MIEAILCCLSVFQDSTKTAPWSQIVHFADCSRSSWKFAVNDQSYGRHFVKIDRKVRSWRQVNLLVRSYTSGCLSSWSLVLFLSLRVYSSYSTFPPVLLPVTSDSSSCSQVQFKSCRRQHDFFPFDCHFFYFSDEEIWQEVPALLGWNLRHFSLAVSQKSVACRCYFFMNFSVYDLFKNL